MVKAQAQLKLQVLLFLSCSFQFNSKNNSWYPNYTPTTPIKLLSTYFSYFKVSKGLQHLKHVLTLINSLNSKLNSNFLYMNRGNVLYLDLCCSVRTNNALKRFDTIAFLCISFYFECNITLAQIFNGQM